MSDIPQSIEALHTGGTQRLDPVRLRHIEALARRAQAHQGETRRLLDARLAQLLADGHSQVRDAERDAARAIPQAVPPSPLADLLTHIASRASASSELQTLRQHRNTWTRLSVDQRLKQALAQVPDSAGPLNTQRLLNQALQLMRDASPEYTQQFMAYVEALLWLDQARLPGARRSGARRPAR
jgi:hypothetical protein